LLEAVRELGRRDPDLAAVVERHGPPPLWAREPGFPTLVLLVLEQQVSLASARAAFDRLVAVTGPPTPDSVLRLDDAELRTIGFSRQKAGYTRDLARALLEGSLELDELATLPDDEVRATLTTLRGIGPWTADVYLTMALRRPDAFPAADLALLVAAQQVKRLPARPTPVELEALAQAWRPHRATAARILWHSYLSERGRS
jgi:DNA-3-methyladenine glycosylase II